MDVGAQNRVILRSARIGTWNRGHPALSAEADGVCCKWKMATDSEYWALEVLKDGCVALRAHNGKYLGAEDDCYSSRLSNSEITEFEKWKMLPMDEKAGTISFQSVVTGKFLSVRGGEVFGVGEAENVTVEAMVPKLWEHFFVTTDPSVRAHDNPTAGRSALIAVSIVAAVATGGLLAIPAAGFGAGGVVAGSLAASIQSVVYGGATAGVFSTLQSVGALGLWQLPAAISAATATGAAAAASKRK